MKLLVEHCNHKIIFERFLTYAELTIDSVPAEIKNDFVGIHMKSFELTGQAKNDDGTVDDVKVLLKLGLVEDTVQFFYNGELIKTEKAVI